MLRFWKRRIETPQCPYVGGEGNGDGGSKGRVVLSLTRGRMRLGDRAVLGSPKGKYMD